MRGGKFKDPPDGKQLRGAGDWVRDGMVWREEEDGSERGREPVRLGRNARPPVGGAETRIQQPERAGTSGEVEREQESAGVERRRGEGMDGTAGERRLTGVPGGMRPPGVMIGTERRDRIEHESDCEGEQSKQERQCVGDREWTQGWEEEQLDVDELIGDDQERQWEVSVGIEASSSRDEVGVMGKEWGSENGTGCGGDERTAEIVLEEGEAEDDREEWEMRGSDLGEGGGGREETVNSDEEDSDSGERRGKRKRRTWVIVVQGDVARGKMIRRMGLAGTDRTMVGIVRTVRIGAVGYRWGIPT